LFTITLVKKRLPHPLTFVSALLYVAAFPPHEFAFLGWVALVPWLVHIGSLEGPRKAREAALQGLWLGSLVTLGGFFWVAYVIQQFGGLPWTVAILMLLLFSLIGQPQWLVFGPIARSTFRSALREGRIRALISLTWLALAYTALDWAVPKLFRDTFGHHMAAHENLRMNARWAGAYGLTFLAAFTNFALSQLVLLLRERREPSAWPAVSRAVPTLATAGVLVAGFWFYGNSTRKWVIEKIDQAESIQLAVIQANIGDLEKVLARQGVRSARQQVLETFISMSDEALNATSPRPAAIVWPETAFPSSFRKPRTADELELDQTVETFAKTRRIPLFFGGYDEDLGFPRKDYNSFFFLGKNAGPDDLQVYHKTRLLLFGEELPFSDVFPALRRWFPQVGNFGRGRGPEPYTLPTTPAVRAAPAICYDVLFADDFAKAKREGSQMILNVTNDSWFGPYAEPQLHLGLSTFRSIETGIPMLRATNTGISAVIDAAGRILQRTEIGVPVVLPARVPLASLPSSPVERWGDFFPRGAATLALIGVAATVATKRRPSRSSKAAPPRETAD
jgi:apolipoprotein N-acyltransferase